MDNIWGKLAGKQSSARSGVPSSPSWCRCNPSFRGRRGYFSAKVDEKSKIKTKFCSEMHFNTEYLQQSGQGELQQLTKCSPSTWQAPALTFAFSTSPFPHNSPPEFIHSPPLASSTSPPLLNSPSTPTLLLPSLVASQAGPGPPRSARWLVAPIPIWCSG